MMMEQEYKYFAFISFSSYDTRWGERLQKKLEGYRMPVAMCNEHGWKRNPMKPVFFAPNDIQPGGLSAELQERLRCSRNLIVVCSPHSATSEWVGREIAFFHELGRTDSIHFFIIDGVPHSGDAATECFNPIIDTLGIPEILGANINEKVFRWSWLNRERAYVQLITKLLGVEFDSIWQRHRRMMIRKMAQWLLGTLSFVLALLGVWIQNRLVSVAMSIAEQTVHNDNLPPLRDAVVTMELGKEKKTDTIRSASGRLMFHNIPHRFLGRSVNVSVRCLNCLPLDTVLVLRRDMAVPLKRDASVFGNVRFGIWDINAERMLGGCGVTIDGIKTRTDASGKVQLHIPLERQKTEYAISADVPLSEKSIRMPCGTNDVVTVAR